MSKKARRGNAGADHATADGKSTREVRGRVLVVEDHEDTRFMLKTILEMDGYFVLEAIDGETGIKLAQKEKPDLILMDFTLPGLDGLSATRQIRRHAVIGDVSIILLSGRSEPGPRQAAIAAGCNEYLVKPVELDQMMLVIEHYVARKKIRGDLTEIWGESGKYECPGHATR